MNNFTSALQVISASIVFSYPSTMAALEHDSEVLLWHQMWKTMGYEQIKQNVMPHYVKTFRIIQKAKKNGTTSLDKSPTILYNISASRHNIIFKTKLEVRTG